MGFGEEKKVTEYIKSMIEYYENGELLNVINFLMGGQQLPRELLARLGQSQYR